MSLPSINLIASTLYYTCQPRHCTYGTSPPDRLETRVAIMPTDQTDKAYRLIAVRDLDYIQPKRIANGRAVKCQSVEVRLTYSVFRNQTSRKSAKESPSGLFGSSCSKP